MGENIWAWWFVVLILGSSSSSSAAPSNNSTAAHQNEGFLKNMWHTLTHQHDHLREDKPASAKAEDEKKAEEEPKKASGSG